MPQRVLLKFFRVVGFQTNFFANCCRNNNWLRLRRHVRLVSSAFEVVTKATTKPSSADDPQIPSRTHLVPVSASLLPTPANPIATPPYCTSSWRLEASRLRQVGFIVCSRQQQTDSPQKRVIEYFEQLLSGFVLPRSDFVSFHLEASKSLDLLLHFCASYGFTAEGDSTGMC